MGDAGDAKAPVPVTQDLIASLKPAKVFKEFVQAEHQVTSLDYDDRGELCVTASDDETIQLYNCRSGKHVKTLYSKKYGVNLARFTHKSSAIVYASTKEDDTVRYHSMHDNKYLQYFRGHKRRVVSLEMSPVDDTFLSGAVDDSVRLWDLRSPAAQGHLRVQGHPVVAYDPTGMVFAVSINERAAVLLYDLRKFDHSPFLTIMIDDTAALSQIMIPPRVPIITYLGFSQTGQYILAGTSGDVHYVLDAFSGQMLFRLVGHVGLERAEGGSIGMVPTAGISGQELCWSPDGRIVIAGSATGQLCFWAIPEQPPASPPETLQPSGSLNGHGGLPRVVAFNPRCAQLSTAGAEVAFWLPDTQM
ncbi:wd40 repeat-like protein [Malassezia pachydermatis]|uniref:Wd40 repeat-like protein n=1 Tax=Malassezia pachydermatis TaxID=77020 RepID=A0A0M8MTS2_9BASI|nr:wd40 repeat-like protein [Malassezia pachydermatis]KOS13640.1 wd40 repeat-like protein [Malassezia pachydermatis]